MVANSGTDVLKYIIYITPQVHYQCLLYACLALSLLLPFNICQLDRHLKEYRQSSCLVMNTKLKDVNMHTYRTVTLLRRAHL
jgi:hypothetical protein